ncbi:DNA methyltransferase [Geminocystis herdmanii]|uniref:DNA methyltransferase n=1 Tax=Geminocystis herdmanii TaxID=669359 RepID=UPI00034C01C4|nr:DNA methyltransferase [Geminocystis herdmanii]
MPLSWNEIKNRALNFSREWANETSENAEAKSFWDNFFDVFGVPRRRVATFEKSVKKLDNKQGFIDLLWKGVILVEHKSKGKNLEKAYQQAIDYFPGLKDHELPKYILISDFAKFKLYDLENDVNHEFLLTEFVDHVHLFDFIAGYKKREYKDSDPVNIHAAELMGELHDRLLNIGYTGHNLEVYLVRLLFCLFADDTGIFNKNIFQEYIDLHTKEDGSDLAGHLTLIFDTLNREEDKRLKILDENLAQFPYINGKLFEEGLPPAYFDREMREMLLKACALDWGKISPAIFGSMFQAVMNPSQRRNLGAHYTSEKNIQKVIKPLFLDDLYNEFEKIKTNHNKLKEFHEKIANLRFLDPACGCGNFLIVSYRELRDLEILILKELNKQGQLELDIRNIIKVDVDQFFGIEYDEFAVRIAEVAMWLIDHQMNIKVSNEFGQYFVRLPLKKSAKIVHGNALQIDWKNIIDPPQPPLLRGENNSKVPLIKGDLGGSNFSFNFIFGNPPFVGKKEQYSHQKADMNLVFNGVKNAGVLDYVCAWYLKASQFTQNTNIRCAFVSTNSISQGEQVSILWQELYTKYNIKIHFAHRSFKWTNEAKGKAAVHCVIIGFANFDILEKKLFDYLDIRGEATEKIVKNINPYLVEGNDLIISKRNQPLSNFPAINYGSMPIDNGILILSDEEKKEFIKKEPLAKQYIKLYSGGKEFINNIKRWCLWLVDVNPNELKKMPLVLETIKQVKNYRESSGRKTTVKLAQTPSIFGEIRQPNIDYILIPKVSSENRKYIPIGINKKEIIASGSCLIIPSHDLFLFGILTSEMHMTWVKYVCGRMKSDYQYSSSIVYNNYPFPDNVTEKQREKVANLAQKILDIRTQYPDSSLADLYDRLTMPRDLLKAHQALDKAVDLCYTKQTFSSELNRIEFLFNLYENITAPLLKTEKKKSRKK